MPRPVTHRLIIVLLCAGLFTACDDASGNGDSDDTGSPTDTGGDADADTAAADTGDTDSGDADAGDDDTGGDTAADAQDTAPDTMPGDTTPGDTDAGDVVMLPVGAACSADLREVLGAAGEVLGACPAELGCADGRCVPACEAAAASGGNVACEFRVATPPSYPPAAPPCHAVFVANTWALPAQLTVTRAGTSYDLTQFARIPQDGVAPAQWPAVGPEGIPVDSVAVLFVSSHPGAQMPETGEPLSCPVTPAVDAAMAIEGSGSDVVFRLESSVPVSAYDILPFGGAPSFFPSAQLLLPTSTWGLQYVVIDSPVGTASGPGPLWLQIVALEGATTVTVLPTRDLPAAGPAPAIAAGASGTFTLEGDTVVQWGLDAAGGDASGTRIVADKPIAVLAGNRFLRLQTQSGPGGEATHQQMLPVTALAHEYVGAPHATRRADLAPEPVRYRLVGAFDGTLLTFEPAIPGAPTTLEQGQVLELETATPFIVRSQDDQHPFAMGQLMSSANLEGGSRPGAITVHPTVCPTGNTCPLGDEEFVLVFPPAQYLSRYVFFTDVTYATTNLVLVRARGADGEYSPVTIDCLGELGGWQPVGTNGEYETTTVDLVRAGLGNGSCVNGRHLAESEAPFGLVVWGVDTYASYAYPAGGNAVRLADLPDIN